MTSPNPPVDKEPFGVWPASWPASSSVPPDCRHFWGSQPWPGRLKGRHREAEHSTPLDGGITHTSMPSAAVSQSPSLLGQAGEPQVRVVKLDLALLQPCLSLQTWPVPEPGTSPRPRCGSVCLCPWSTPSPLMHLVNTDCATHPLCYFFHSVSSGTSLL